MGVMIPTRDTEAEQQFDIIAGDIRDDSFHLKMKDALNTGWKPAGMPAQDGSWVMVALTRFVNKDGEPVAARMGMGLMGGLGSSSFGY